MSEWDRLWHLPENREFDIGPSWRSKLRQVRRLVDDLDVSGRLLDVACGTGRLLKEWEKSATDLVGVDASGEALKAATAYFPQARYQQLNIEKEKLLETFEWVFCTNALEEMSQDTSALQNMADMVKPGGHLVLVVPHRKAYWTSKDKMAGNKRRYEREDLVAKVEQAGLTVIRTRAWGWPLYRLWYRFMENVDQGAVWNSTGRKKRLAHLVAGLVYRVLYLDDCFTFLPYGSILFLVAKRP